ncbi:MAG TPA: hypothetical protein ENJ18_03695, partial [Nannocystis exedens]|nr:hypothetical protein [Nannocystis exedens]
KWRSGEVVKWRGGEVAKWRGKSLLQCDHSATPQLRNSATPQLRNSATPQLHARTGTCAHRNMRAQEHARTGTCAHARADQFWSFGASSRHRAGDRRVLLSPSSLSGVLLLAMD